VSILTPSIHFGKHTLERFSWCCNSYSRSRSAKTSTTHYKQAEIASDQRTSRHVRPATKLESWRFPTNIARAQPTQRCHARYRSLPPPTPTPAQELQFSSFAGGRKTTRHASLRRFATLTLMRSLSSLTFLASPLGCAALLLLMPKNAAEGLWWCLCVAEEHTE
jgi:hypothetical protein